MLHLVTPAPDDRAGVSDVVALEQDENQYHSQQIWWIEPLADAKTLVGDPIYSITNPCDGKALRMRGAPGKDCGRTGTMTGPLNNQPTAQVRKIPKRRGSTRQGNPVRPRCGGGSGK